MYIAFYIQLILFNFYKNVFGMSESRSKLYIRLLYSNFCTIHISSQLQLDQLNVMHWNSLFLTLFLMECVFFEQNKLPNARQSIDSRQCLITSPRLITSEQLWDGFVQSRSKKEVEALLQGTLGNNNAYLEKKKKLWRPASNKDKIREKKAATYNDLTSLKTNWINSNES